MADWTTIAVIVMMIVVVAFFSAFLVYPSREEEYLMLNDPYFEYFEEKFPEINNFNPKRDCEAFALDEFRRFRSIAGTIRANFLNVDTNIDERIFTQILLRSLLENFFWLLYIFYENSSSSWDTRFEEYLNGFKKEYYKLYNDNNLPHKANIEPAELAWAKLPKPMDINSMLTQLFNDYGNRLDYLYFTYRITSFDTHGKSNASLFRISFGKECHFPYLKIEQILNFIANEYLDIWKKLTQDHNP